MMPVVGYVFLVVGALFTFLGMLGLVRMPDVFNRIQAGTKATTLGFLSIDVGLFFLHPEWWSKLLVIAVFILLTNPIGSHNLARAAHVRGEKMIGVNAPGRAGTARLAGPGPGDVQGHAVAQGRAASGEKEGAV